MSSFDWERFLRQWSQVMLESMTEAQLAQLPQEVVQSCWLGYPGATEEQLSQTEARLGVTLPPSYRAFLTVTNGWRQTTPFIHKLWSTEGIERFAVRHQKWIEAFTNHHEETQVGFEYAIEMDEMWESPSVADEEYFVYGEEQDCSKLRAEYLKTAIEISDVGEASLYLLNPQIVAEDREWEAWFFGDWLPGADRYPSFREMMVAEYQNFLELRDSASTQSEASTASESLLIAKPLALSLTQGAVPVASQEPSCSPSEPASNETSAVWRSLTRLIVEFQTRQPGEWVEYRTVATAEGKATDSWAGLGQQKLRYWLQAQLTRETQTRPIEPVIVPVAEQPPLVSEQTKPSAKTSVSATNSPAIDSPAIDRTESPLDLNLELDQLAIRQNARRFAHIVVNPATLNQAKKTGYASLTSQQPFSLQVTFNLVGQSITNLPPQPVTYQAQFHAQNRATGQWFALGETRPNALVSHQQVYTAYLFDKTLEPGMYRLQVLATLRGAVVALTSFELPLLTIV